MENLEKILMKIEKNYENKDKREKVDFNLKGEVYEVLLLNRKERAELFFSRYGKMNSGMDCYEWLKPYIYKCFQLKEAAMKAKEAGYIKTYYEVVDMLFNPEELAEVMNFMLKAHNFWDFHKEEVELQKKQ